MCSKVSGPWPTTIAPWGSSTWWEFLLTGQLKGMTIELNGDGIEHDIVNNGYGRIVLAQAPDTPVQAGDSFVVTAQDDTRKEFEERAALPVSFERTVKTKGKLLHVA